MKAKKIILVVMAIAMMVTNLTGCGNNSQSVGTQVDEKDPGNDKTDEQGKSKEDKNDNEENQEDYNGKLILDSSMELKFAKNFSVDYYKGGYKMITISSGDKFLTVPEGMKTPEELEENTVVIQLPLKDVLISSTPMMSLISSINQLDKISQTTTKMDSWYIDEVKEKMEKGDITYIGDYKSPDYEVLASNTPKFAVFSTMLSSVPEVIKKLEELNIPVLIDQSTYEEHPLGRVEWMKLFGALFDCEEKAEEAFNKQVEYAETIDSSKVGDKTACIFYITSKNILYVRNAGDYMTKMIEIAGGKYIMSDLNPDKTGTQTLEFEEFYDKAKDADYIIYIWTLGGKPETLKEFTEKNELFADLKAVKEGNVWCTTPDFFQISNTIGYMIKDINEMFTLEDKSVDKLTYLFRLK